MNNDSNIKLQENSNQTNLLNNNQSSEVNTLLQKEESNNDIDNNPIELIKCSKTSSGYLKPNSNLNNITHKQIDETNNLNNFTRFKYTGEEDDDYSVIYNADYSFINRYLELNNNSYPDFFLSNIQVYVRSFNVQEDQLNIFNYVMYKLEGLYDDRNFEVDRRYKDFMAFRKLLSNNFPGLMIPAIPPKKAFGNLEEGFLKLRKKFLQQFFNRVISAPHLATSYETKVFLEPRNLNYCKLPFEIYHKSYHEILEDYESYFYFLKDLELTNRNKTYVEDFYIQLNRTKDQLENFVLLTTEGQNSKMEMDQVVQNLYENMFELDNDYFYEMLKLDKDTKTNFNKDVIECGLTENLYRTRFESNYTCFYDWSNIELIDTDAMIETIQVIFKYKELFHKKLASLKQANEALEKISNPGFLQSFILPYDLNAIQNKNFEVNNTKREVLALKNLTDIIYKILYYIEIPVFRRDKLKFYHEFLNKIAINEHHQKEKNNLIYNFLKEHYERIMESANIQHINIGLINDRKPT